MSYLDIPRLHLAGSFYTDPSTMDNDPQHYNTDVVNPSPWQEPLGKHEFKILDCTVVSVMDSTGTLQVGDPLVGNAFGTVAAMYPDPSAPPGTGVPPVEAKLVDLDTYQQAVSTIYGMQVSLDCGGGLTLTGLCDPPNLNASWFSAVLPERGWDNYGNDSPGGDSNAAGCFNTVIRIPVASWAANAGPASLQALRAASAVVGNDVVVSFHFTLDAYIIGGETAVLAPGAKREPGIAYRRFGRFMGAIGPWQQGEPIQAAGPRLLAGRQLPPLPPTPVPAWYVPSANNAWFQVSSATSTLTIDLANALCRDSIGGAPVDLGTLTAYAGPSSNPVALGTVPYATMFGLAAGICDIPLSPTAVQAATTSAVWLSSSRTDLDTQTLWAEPQDGVLIAPDVRALRMTSETGSPGSTATVPVYLTQFGQPYVGQQLQVVIVSVHGNTPGATCAPSNPGDTAQADGALTGTITPSGSNGVATLTFNVVKDPGSRTPLLDGQLYFIYPNFTGQAPTTSPQQESQISVVAYQSYPVIANPQWTDIEPLMVVYDKLFPSMRQYITLTDQHSFTVFMNNPPWYPVLQNSDPTYNVGGVSRGAIGWYLTRDDNDPTKMPLSRDLSPNKIATVLNYVLNNPVVPTPPPSHTPTTVTT